MRASIVIPHYRTPNHLDLCLRCIARFTPEPCEVIVVDNGTEAGELEAFRGWDGVSLLERSQEGEAPQTAHARALDLGIGHAKADHIVAMHSDTYVLREGWLDLLLAPLESGAYDICGPWSHRIYPLSLRERIERAIRGPKPPRDIRPTFTAYRKTIFESARFGDFEKVYLLGEPYRQAGRVRFLDRDEASRFAFHSGGSTLLELLQHRGKARRRKQRQFRHLLERPELQELVAASAARRGTPNSTGELRRA